MTKTEYIYKDENGKPLYVKHRGPNKKFFFDPKPQDVRVPYLLNTWHQFSPNDDPLFICEGEKDALNLSGINRNGPVWTTALDTHSKDVFDHCAKYFKGAQCYIVEDHDNAGRKRSAELSDWLQHIASDIAIIRFKGEPDKYDVSDWIETHPSANIYDLLQLAEHVEPKPPYKRPGVGLKPQLGGQWLIDRVVPQNALTAIVGPYGQGKSFFALDMCWHLAKGMEWQGHQLNKSKVLYYAMEGGAALENRLFALQDRYGEAPGFYFTSAVRKDGELVPPELLEDIENNEIDFLVFDTLSKFQASLDENAAGDMSTVISQLEDWAHHCAIMVIAHPPKAGGTTIRGSGAWDAAVSCLMTIENQIVTIQKQREGTPADDMAFNLRQVELGYDANGWSVTTCVVDEADADEKRQQNLAEEQSGQAEERLAPAVREVHEMLAKGLYITRDQVPEDHSKDFKDLPSSPSVKLVSRKTLYERMEGIYDISTNTARKQLQKAKKANQICSSLYYLWTVGD